MPTKASIVILLVFFGLAGAISWQGCQVIRAVRSLPVHSIPATTQPMMISNVNPQATDALQQLQNIGDLVPKYPTITVPLHANRAEPVFDYIRRAVAYRGGATRAICPDQLDVANCTLDTAFPAPMFRELQQLEKSDFQEFQDWIDAQPAAPAWEPDQNLVITSINFRQPYASAWPLHGSSAAVMAMTEIIIAISWLLALMTIPCLIIWTRIQWQQGQEEQARTRNLPVQDMPEAQPQPPTEID